MCLLHYSLSRMPRCWVVFCEDAPVDMFERRDDAIAALNRLTRDARNRGDEPVVRLERARAVAPEAA